MENLQTMTTFLGWCAVINIALYSLTALTLTAFKTYVVSIHTKITGLSVGELDKAYFNYLAIHKLAIIFFNVIPYLALKVMAA